MVWLVGTASWTDKTLLDSRNSVPAVWETTYPEHALLRLHGRNTEAYMAPAKSAAERFDYVYSSEDLHLSSERFRPIARSVKYAHAVFNNCMEDKAQINAREFRETLRELL